MDIHQTPTIAKVIAFNSFVYIPFTPFLTWLKLPHEALFILGILLALDYVTGILKVFVLKGTLRSYRAIAGLVAKASILFLIFALAFMAKALHLNFEMYLSFFISALIISETYSIFGNGYSIHTREEIAEFDAVAMVLKKVRGAIERVLVINRDVL